MTMKYAAVAAICLAMMMLPHQAQAVMLTNTDEDTATVTVIVGEEEQMYEVAPGETLDSLCIAGCTAIFGNGEEVVLKGNETVRIVQDKPVVSQ
jgi:hypothetical protein